jgi:fructose-1,6-bisphosphatase
LFFTEQSKSAINNLGMFRPATQPSSFRANLYKLGAGNSTQLADGVYAMFGDSYNTAVTIEDAVKFFNINETFGLFRNNVSLSVERGQQSPSMIPYSLD